MKSGIGRRAIAALAAAGLVLAAWPATEANEAAAARFLQPKTAPAPLEAEPLFATEVVARRADGVAHSPTVLALDDGSVRVLWFEGETEAGMDVDLRMARRDGGVWGAPKVVTSSWGERAEGRRFVKTIGNPTLWRDEAGTIWLAYVAPALGGWSTSRISLRRSVDGGATFGPPRDLRLSPIFNMAHLTRFPALPMEGGRYGLPAYGELIWGMTEIAVLDSEGRVTDRRRIGGGGDSGIQADLLWVADGRLEAFLRPVGAMEKRAFHTFSDDRGLSWSDPAPLDWPNPGAPLCSERFADGSAVLASNEEPKVRSALSLRYRPAGEASWRKVDVVIAGDPVRESLSYCSISVAADGVAHMVYSRFSDRSIRHVAFNRRWLHDHSRGKAP